MAELLKPDRPCEACGKPGWGRFCSYACWRAARGSTAGPPTSAPSTPPPKTAPPETAAEDPPSVQASAVVSPPPAIPSNPKADCVACGGTRINSKGGPCVPCQVRETLPEPVDDLAAPWSYCGEPLEMSASPALRTRKPAKRQAAEAGQLSLF